MNKAKLKTCRNKEIKGKKNTKKQYTTNHWTLILRRNTHAPLIVVRLRPTALSTHNKPPFLLAFGPISPLPPVQSLGHGRLILIVFQTQNRTCLPNRNGVSVSLLPPGRHVRLASAWVGSVSETEKSMMGYRVLTTTNKKDKTRKEISRLLTLY